MSPYEDQLHGCDWSKVKPDWISDHGTVIVLLGNDPSADTVLGDPERPSESIAKGISLFLNRRIYQNPDNVEIYVHELRHEDKANWPKSVSDASTYPTTGQVDNRTNRRRIEGAHYYITSVAGKKNQGQLASRGVVPLSDGTQLGWFLWSGERPAVHMYAAEYGYVERKKIERLFGEAKHILALTRLRLRGLTGARDEFLLTATVQNLKRLGTRTSKPPPGLVVA